MASRPTRDRSRSGKTARRRPGRPPRSARRPPPREALLDAADRLFYREGVASTGVERLARAARVSKVSIYQHFGSKTELAGAYVERRAALWRTWFSEQMAGAPRAPRARLLFVFDVVGRFIARPDFCGCAFIRAASDESEAAPRIRGPAWQVKRATRADLAALATACGVARPAELAEQLALLIDGVLVTAMMGGVDAGRGALQAARAAAGQLLAACGGVPDDSR